MVPAAIRPRRSCSTSSAKTASSMISGPTCFASRARHVRCSRPSYLYTRTTIPSSRARLFSATLRPVSQKLGLSLICQRVIEQLVDHLPRDRRDVGAHTRRFDHVNRMAQARREYFRLPTVVVIDLDDGLQQLESILTNVVEPADK